MSYLGVNGGAMNHKVIGLALVVLVSGSEAAMAATDGFTCPASIEVAEAPLALTGWIAAGDKVRHALRHVSFIQSKEELAPEERLSGKLARDSWVFEKSGNRLIQNWKFDRTKGAIVAVCRYHDSSATYSAELPGGIRSCRFASKVDGLGTITTHAEVTCQ
jgi:hypothetical protein